MMLRRTTMTFSIAMVLAASGLASAQIQETILNEAFQGEGNKGPVYRPLDIFGLPSFFDISAASNLDDSAPLDPTAFGDAGTVYIGTGDTGVGVQTWSAGGSKGISGGGRNKDEELIFTFDSPIPVSSIIIGFTDVDFGALNDKDDPVLFFSVAGSGSYGVTVEELDIFAAYTQTGDKRGTVDFSLLSGISGQMIDSFKVRETNGHLYVTSMVNAVPEPGSIGLLVLGGLSLLRRRSR